MATIKPFPALRPRPSLAERICELPYDVLSTEEARQIAARNPLSFLHVSKPEIDFPPQTDPHAPEVYLRGKENFDRLVSDGNLRQDDTACFYLYRQVLGSHRQTGLVAAASCEEYLHGVIRKHELTRPDKEDDRVRHIEILNAQTGPAFLTYPTVRSLDEFVSQHTGSAPDMDFTAADGVRHSSWRIADPQDVQWIESEFSKIPALYIADGHHRSAAAARVYRNRRGAGHSAGFLSVIFPHDQLQILPYNRVLKDLNNLSIEPLLEKLGRLFLIEKDAAAAPAERHQICLYLKGRWHRLTFRPEYTASRDPIEQLDVTLLQKQVLDPLFAIHDPRTSDRLQFVGGVRGTRELERLVDAGDFACAFSLYPTRIEDLMAIADSGGIMPPKSTWFEPKLRDALFCHLIS